MKPKAIPPTSHSEPYFPKKFPKNKDKEEEESEFPITMTNTKTEMFIQDMPVIQAEEVIQMEAGLRTEEEEKNLTSTQTLQTPHCQTEISSINSTSKNKLN